MKPRITHKPRDRRADPTPARRLDLLCLGEAMAEFDERPDGSLAPSVGGDVSNVAIAAARQGAAVGIATRVGTDRFGDDLLEFWRREGVDASAVARDPEAPTGVYFIRHRAKATFGECGHSFEYRRAGSAASRMTPETLPRAAMRGARALHFSGISQAISTGAEAACAAAVREARAAGATVSYDPNLRLALWPLERARAVIHRTMGEVDVALPGLDDARILTGLTAPEEIARFYLDLGPRIVALTLGADGVLLAEPGRMRRIPAPQVDVVDASGAGDCFDGAFLARRLAGDALEDAALYAVTAAALSVRRSGAAAAPNRGEVEAALTRSQRLDPRPPLASHAAEPSQARSPEPRWNAAVHVKPNGAAPRPTGLGAPSSPVDWSEFTRSTSSAGPSEGAPPPSPWSRRRPPSDPLHTPERPPGLFSDRARDAAGRLRQSMLFPPIACGDAAPPAMGDAPPRDPKFWSAPHAAEPTAPDFEPAFHERRTPAPRTANGHRLSLALVAHDKLKPALAAWVAAHTAALRPHRIVATGTTAGVLLQFAPELDVTALKSGPLGGDQQIGAMIAAGDVDALIFFPDPMTPMPHDVDVKALFRIALVMDTPCAFSRATADLLVRSGFFDGSSKAAAR